MHPTLILTVLLHALLFAREVSGTDELSELARLLRCECCNEETQNVQMDAPVHSENKRTSATHTFPVGVPVMAVGAAAVCLLGLTTLAASRRRSSNSASGKGRTSVATVENAGEEDALNSEALTIEMNQQLACASSTTSNLV